MDLKSSQTKGTRSFSSKVSETTESEERFYQPGAAGIWGKYNGQLLECKSHTFQLPYQCYVSKFWS